MDDWSFRVPGSRLPSGRVERIDDPPPSPALPQPAATVLLMRDAERGFKVLLLKRVHTARFFPGAYVFPGGRVEATDLDPGVLARTSGLTLERAGERTRLHDARPPAAAYYLAAVREAFEETGILVARTADGDPMPTAAASAEVLEVRDELLRGACSFAQALVDLDALIDDAAMEYIGHWITPVAEPRRYDTRFFAAAVPPGSEPAIHTREVLAGTWITPAEALERAREGSLPMVFPTIKTLESVREFATTSEILRAFRSRSIPSVLPRPIQTPDGIPTRILEISSD